MKRVIITAGHNTDAPGAIGLSGTKEADVTQAIVRNIAWIFSNNPVLEGVETFYDRPDYSFLQTVAAVRTMATPESLILDIHCNSFRGSQARGTEAIVRRLETKDPADTDTLKFATELVSEVATTVGTKVRHASRHYPGLIDHHETARGSLFLFEGARNEGNVTVFQGRMNALMAKDGRYKAMFPDLEPLDTDGIAGPKTLATAQKVAEIPGIVCLLEVGFLSHQEEEASILSKIPEIARTIVQVIQTHYL